MDYRELLKKYMAHIIELEGDSYLDFIGQPFTLEEMAALLAIESEVSDG